MDVKEIRALTEIFTKAGLTRMKVAEGDFSLCLEKQAETAAVQPLAAPVEVLPLPMADLAPAPAETVDFNRMMEVKSPMVGVFYASPSPDAPPFVKRGDAVKRGDVLCIIEAMKLMNEITAETDGEVVDICAENGQVVEFSQTLFKIC